jgi:hypothetical protein
MNKTLVVMLYRSVSRAKWESLSSSARRSILREINGDDVLEERQMLKDLIEERSGEGCTGLTEER